MKKFTTTFFLLMAMVLLLPTEVKAVDYYLGTSTGGGWTMASEKFQEVDGKYEIIVTIPDANDFLFCIFKTNSVSWEEAIRPNDNIYGTSGTGFATSGDNVWHPDVYNSFASALKFVYDPTGNTWSLTRLVDLRSKGNGNFGTPTYLESPSNDEKYSGDVTFSTGDECKVIARSVSDNKATNKWYGGAYDALTITDSNITAPGVGTYNVNVDFSGSQKKIVFTAAAPATKFPINYGGTDYESTSNASPYTFKIPQSAFVDGTGLSFTIKDSEGNTYNPSSDTELANGVAAQYTTGSASWTCNEKSNASGYTVTLNTTDKTVALTYSTSSTPIPVADESYYLVGNFFTEDGANINYDRKIFRFDSDGTGNYTLDIPATLTVDCQVIGVKDGVVTVYAPSGAYDIKGDWPNDNLAVSGTLATTTLGDASNKWSFTTRNLTSDGIYTITLSESATKWDIKHNGNKRMAYYLSTMDGATAQPSYTEDRGSLVTTNGKPAYDNRYFGYIYLEKDAKCWIISNLLKQIDSGNTELSKTTTKLYYQGNVAGAVGGGDDGAKVFPNGTSSLTSQPFTIGNIEKDLSVMLEYNPTQGDGSGKYSYELGYEQGIGGRIVQASSEDVNHTTLPEINSMQIVGDGVNGTWNAGDAYEMYYNATERCWEATFTTTKAESKENHFRFIANRKLEYNFGEVNTVARVPYLDDEATGVSALPADPNDVQYHAETDGVTHEYMTGDDIIFNRPAGVWTVKFYITQELAGAGGKYEYDFKYTINGTPTEIVPVEITGFAGKFLRTYSYAQDLNLPADESVKAYEAYRFVPGDKTTKNHGLVYLRRIKYIPAGMGVVIVGKDVPNYENEKKTYNLTVRTETSVTKNEELWWKWEDTYKEAADEWNNYFVGPVSAVAELGNAEADAENKIIARYFGLGCFFDTKEYNDNKSSYTDGDNYIGFFRLTGNARLGANKAYLRIPAVENEISKKYGYIDFNGQWLDDEYDSPEVTTLSKTALVFDDIDFNDPTAIKNVNDNNVKDDAYYTLQGIKVAKPTQGLYIHNGKKVIIK